MKEALIYTSLGGGNLDYCKLTKELYKSIRLHHSKDEIDFGVICDHEHWENLGINEMHLHPSKIGGIDDDHPIISYLTAKRNDQAAANKLLISEYDLFFNYKCIIHFDSDGILCKPLTALIDRVKENEFHVVEEGQFDNIFHSLLAAQNKLPKLPAEIADLNIKTFNSGQFLFKPSYEIKKIFRTVFRNWINQRHVTKFPANGEQAPLNDELIYKHYKMLRYLDRGTEVSLGNFKGIENISGKLNKFKSANWFPGIKEYVLPQLPIFWHFLGGSHSMQEKLNIMKECSEFICDIYKEK